MAGWGGAAKAAAQAANAGLQRSAANRGVNENGQTNALGKAAKTAEVAGNTVTVGGWMIAHWKLVLILLIIIITVFVTGVSANIVATSVANARGIEECSEGIDKGEITSYLEETGQMDEVTKAQFDSITEEESTCPKSGAGYTGEVYPPTIGTVTALFREFRNDDWGPRYHMGLDIAKGCGTPIYAFSGGEVVKVVLGAEGRGYPMGEVVIQHTETFATKYFHSPGSSIKVKVGDIVSAGQEIAAQGDSGHSFGCHLHIEAMVNGVQDDMLPILQSCGFDYKLGSYFGELPEAPIMCGDAAGDPKSYAKGEVQKMFKVNGLQLTSEFECLDKLWTKESGWNHTARNPSSGAYGIPQSLPGNKMATEGADWQTNPQTQIRWGLKYIQNRYGTPCAAWQHSVETDWY